jgi:hypothetical protein
VFGGGGIPYGKAAAERDAGTANRVGRQTGDGARGLGENLHSRNQPSPCIARELRTRMRFHEAYTRADQRRECGLWLREEMTCSLRIPRLIRGVRH